MKTTCLTTSKLAERIKYDARTIRNQLKDSVCKMSSPDAYHSTANIINTQCSALARLELSPRPLGEKGY